MGRPRLVLCARGVPTPVAGRLPGRSWPRPPLPQPAPILCSPRCLGVLDGDTEGATTMEGDQEHVLHVAPRSASPSHCEAAARAGALRTRPPCWDIGVHSLPGLLLLQLTQRMIGLLSSSRWKSAKLSSSLIVNLSASCSGRTSTRLPVDKEMTRWAARATLRGGGSSRSISRLRRLAVLGQ